MNAINSMVKFLETQCPDSMLRAGFILDKARQLQAAEKDALKQQTVAEACQDLIDRNCRCYPEGYLPVGAHVETTTDERGNAIERLVEPHVISFNTLHEKCPGPRGTRCAAIWSREECVTWYYSQSWSYRF